MDQQFGLSIHDQIRQNRWRTLYLLIAFPIIIIGLAYIGAIIGLAVAGENPDPIEIATSEISHTIGFWLIVFVAIWSTISYFAGSKMIMAFAQAKPLAKKDNPTLYRIVENASIAAGLPRTPEIHIIEDLSLNAFATGTSPQNAKVAISRGLLQKLTKPELEAVMAHEVGHILNRDIRVMLISVALVGAIEMIGEILIRVRTRGSSKNNKGSGAIIIIGLLFLTVGVILGTLTRLAISREREYLADATSAHLTSNPLALASALEKIAADSRIEALDQKASMAGLCIADPSERGNKNHHEALRTHQVPKKSGITAYWQKIWSTHPPILERINHLRKY